MGITNFPNGVSSFGMPIFGSGAMSLPLMSKTGTAYFVDPVHGADANTGKTLSKPMKTVSAAYAKTTDKAGDVVYLLNDGNTSGTSREDATITWSNDNTHLMGLCAPSMISQRARISPTTTLGSIVTPQLVVSGNGNVFANVSFFEGDDQDATPSVCVSVTGDRNYFWNVAMMNMGSANSGDEATSSHLLLTGAEENLFERCYIGLDTAARSTTNANVELVSASARNIFKDCFFPAYADNAGVLFVKIDGAGDIDRFVMFERCIFTNADNSAGTTMTAAMDVHASAGGHVLVKDCMLVGATDWEAADSTVILLGGPGVGVAADIKEIGIAQTVDVS